MQKVIYYYENSKYPLQFLFCFFWDWAEQHGVGMIRLSTLAIWKEELISFLQLKDE